MGFLLFQQEARVGVRVLTSQRVQVSPTRFRVPDVCVVLASDPRDPIVHHPPVLCVEVLSRVDTVTRLNERLSDYFQMGVRYIWALDPLTRAEMQDVLRELMAGLKKTVLLVTHDLDEAIYLASRIVLIEDGRIAADLPSEEFLKSTLPSVAAYAQAFDRGVGGPYANVLPNRSS